MLLHTPAELPVGAEVTRGGRQQRLLHTPVEHPFGAESSPHSAASMGNAAEQSRPANPAANGGGSASASAPGTSLAGRGEEGSAGGPSREAALGQGRVSSADGQNRQQQSAGATAPISVPDVPDAPPVKPEDAPAIILQALLGKLSSLDASSFFQDPVTEAVAPGYFDFIKRPMCFQRMREKLLSREYRTWRSFVEDFELICSNASTYNRKNSKIHKAAATLLRAGRKLLQSSELEGRKAVQLLHPDGPRAAAREDEAEAAACATPFSSGPLSNASCAAGNLKAPDSAGPLQSGG